MTSAKERSRANTSKKLELGLAELQKAGKKTTITAVAKAAGVEPSLVHNTYPEIAERIRTLTGKATRAQHDAKQAALLEERKKNQALRKRCAELEGEISKLASVNQALVLELSARKGVSPGMLWSCSRTDGPWPEPSSRMFELANGINICVRPTPLDSHSRQPFARVNTSLPSALAPIEPIPAQ